MATRSDKTYPKDVKDSDPDACNKYSYAQRIYISCLSLGTMVIVMGFICSKMKEQKTLSFPHFSTWIKLLRIFYENARYVEEFF